MQPSVFWCYGLWNKHALQIVDGAKHAIQWMNCTPTSKFYQLHKQTFCWSVTSIRLFCVSGFFTWTAPSVDCLVLAFTRIRIHDPITSTFVKLAADARTRVSVPFLWKEIKKQNLNQCWRHIAKLLTCVQPCQIACHTDLKVHAI